MKRALLFMLSVVVVLSAGTASAFAGRTPTTSTISGVVTEGHTGMPLSGVTVGVYSIGKNGSETLIGSTATNASGSYALVTSTSGINRVRFNYTGLLPGGTIDYRNDYRDVTVTLGTNVGLNYGYEYQFRHAGGRVTVGGAAASGAQVRVYRTSATTATPVVCATAVADAAGYWRTADADAANLTGSAYKVEFTYGGATLYNGQAASLAAAPWLYMTQPTGTSSVQWGLRLVNCAF